MERYTYDGDNRRKIEIFLGVIYSVYSLYMIAEAMGKQWSDWILLVLVLLPAGTWVVLAGKCKDYVFRAKFTTIAMQISLILYFTQQEELAAAFPVFMVFVVLLGYYGIAELIYSTLFSILIIFSFHGVIAKTYSFKTLEEVIKVCFQLGNILFLQKLVYSWAKRNNEGSRKLLGTLEELREVESRKDDFLANVSHEIRTPINTICGMSELLLREELPYKIKEKIQSIQMSGRNLMTVVSDILDFSELQSGNIELEEEAYNLPSTINDVINMTVARKKDKNLELVVDCAANIPSVLQGDEKKLRRIIMDLVDNAIKFTDEGGISITIACRKESYGINLVITVKDTGIGMDEKGLEQLFSSFHQADNSRKRQDSGIGLGLAISQVLVQKMGGVITVKSRLGRGTSVRFAVPQKVLDETPITSLRNPGSINVATYIDMEQFNVIPVRDEYSRMIVHMVEQLKAVGKCQICRNLAELQRRESKEQFSHVFISATEYRGNPAYFDALAERTRLVVILDKGDEKYVTNPRLLKIYKPFYILSIASVLNSDYTGSDEPRLVRQEKFVTEDVHILVVDDNQMNLRVVEGLLECYKIKVTSATSGKEALEKLILADYDFIFMDQMMPEMDGVETLRRIRQKVGTYYKKVPVIALTANAVAGSREMLLAEGFTDFLEKPIERSVLERVLQRNLPRQKIIYQEERTVELKDQEAVSVPEETTERVEKASAPEEARERVEKASAPEEARESAVKAPAPEEARERVEKASASEKARESAVKAPAPEETGSPSAEQLERELGREGLDVRKGIVYCSGIDHYMNVLQGFCMDKDELRAEVEQAFRKKDWKNYTIIVHGIKSAMRSIGATQLSGIAEQLEHAGREDRIQYLLEHHEELMEEYDRLFQALCKNVWLCPQTEESAELKQSEQESQEQKVQEQKPQEELPVLAGDSFDRILSEMEEAMYALDGKQLLSLMTELRSYQYHGTALNTLLQPVMRKVEMADYISAVEMVERLKKKLDGEEVGEQ